MLAEEAARMIDSMKRINLMNIGRGWRGGGMRKGLNVVKVERHSYLEETAAKFIGNHCSGFVVLFDR